MEDYNINEITNISCTLPAAYRLMTDAISAALPAIDRNTVNFNKSHSQFMVATLDITALTPIRSIKHTLAEISRTRHALEEAHVKRANLDIDEREQTALLDHLDGFELERVRVRLIEIGYQKNALDASAQGAVRKLAYLCKVHSSLLQSIGKSEITEAEYEAEEARYHVMTCLKQALCAARARGGVIDEGNHIYLFDMGLPASLVQRRVLDYLKSEDELLASGKAATHGMTIEWIQNCADELQGCAAAHAAWRGMPLRDDTSLIGGADGLQIAQHTNQ